MFKRTVPVEWHNFTNIDTQYIGRNSGQATEFKIIVTERCEATALPHCGPARHCCFSLRSLPVQLRSLSTELYNLYTELSSLSVELRNLYTKLSSPSAQLHRLPVQLRSLSAELRSLSTELHNLYTELSSLSAELRSPSVQLRRQYAQLHRRHTTHAAGGRQTVGSRLARGGAVVQQLKGSALRGRPPIQC